MIIVDHYSRYLLHGCIRIQSKETCTCPDCHGKLRVRDSKLRRVINQAGETEIYRLRRYKCQGCGKLHTELPSCIAPYKHYAADVIGAEIFHVREDCPAENSTILRWRQIVIAFLQCIKDSGLNISKLLQSFGVNPQIKQDCNNTHPLWISRRKLKCYNSC